MNETASLGFDTVTEFLAHAHALEQELVERYEEMADSMEVHNNSEAASLFRQLAKYAESHSGKLTAQVEMHDMPKIAPWEFQWLDLDDLGHCMEARHYLMSVDQGLKLALCMEEMSRHFYALTQQGSTCQPVKELAEEMRALKEKHIALLYQWLKSEPERHELPAEDLDPPNMPV